MLIASCISRLTNIFRVQRRFRKADELLKDLQDGTGCCLTALEAILSQLSAAELRKAEGTVKKAEDAEALMLNILTTLNSSNSAENFDTLEAAGFWHADRLREVKLRLEAWQDKTGQGRVCLGRCNVWGVFLYLFACLGGSSRCMSKFCEKSRKAQARSRFS